LEVQPEQGVNGVVKGGIHGIRVAPRSHTGGEVRLTVPQPS
jgi:hypothetical protein